MPGGILWLFWLCQVSGSRLCLYAHFVGACGWFGGVLISGVRCWLMAFGGVLVLGGWLMVLGGLAA